jgi:type I restriction enzyme S subunit
MAKRQADNLVKGAAQKTLNLGELNKVKIFLPPLNVQKHFSGIAENIESQKVKAEASLQKSEALFNSLLQRAFRGELFAEGVEREETAAGPIAAGAAQLKLF